MLRRVTITLISEYWGRLLASQLDLEPAAEEVLAFGFKLVLGFLFSVGILILVSWPLGLVPHAAAASVTGGLLRLASGGAHSVTPAGCAVFGGLITVVLAALARLGGMFLAQDLIRAVSLLAIPWTLASCVLYAPAAAPNKPLSPHQARRLALISLVLAATWGGAILGFGQQHPELWLASALGISWQGFSLTPLGHRFATTLDNVNWGRRCGKR